MTLELKVTNDQGEVIAYATGPPWQPLAWRSPPGKPLIIDRGKDGAYLISTITTIPIVAIDLNYNRLGAGIGTINPVQQNTGPSVPTGGSPSPSYIVPPYSAGTQSDPLGTTASQSSMSGDSADTTGPTQSGSPVLWPGTWPRKQV